MLCRPLRRRAIRADPSQTRGHTPPPNARGCSADCVRALQSLEPCVFSLDMPEALPTIGPYMIAADVLPMDQKHLEQEMAAKIAKRLLTVCLSFDELPAIRYQHGQTCAQHVATALNGLFDGMERARDGPKCVTGPASQAPFTFTVCLSWPRPSWPVAR